jgi:hypothetical protein
MDLGSNRVITEMITRVLLGGGGAEVSVGLKTLENIAASTSGVSLRAYPEILMNLLTVILIATV